MECQASSSAPNLPNEVLIESFKFLAGDKSLKRNLRMVSKRFNDLITPLLYVSWAVTKKVCSVVNRKGARKNHLLEVLRPTDLVDCLENAQRYAEQVAVPRACGGWGSVLLSMRFPRLKSIKVSESDCSPTEMINSLVNLEATYNDISIHLVHVLLYQSSLISDINASQLTNIVTFDMTSDQINKACINDIEILLINQVLEYLHIYDISTASSLAHNPRVRRLTKFHGKSFAALKQLDLRTCHWAFDKDEITGRWDFSRMIKLDLAECDMEDFLDIVDTSQLQLLGELRCTDVCEGFLNYSMNANAVRRRIYLNDRALRLVCSLNQLQTLEIRTQSTEQALMKLYDHQAGLRVIDLRINTAPTEASESYHPTQSLLHTAKNFTALNRLTLTFPWIRIPCMTDDIQFLCNDRGDDETIKAEHWPRNLSMAHNLQWLHFRTESLAEDVPLRRRVVPGHESCHSAGPEKVQKFAIRIFIDLISLKQGRPLTSLEFDATIRTHVNVASANGRGFETWPMVKHIAVQWEDDGSGEPPDREIFTDIFDHVSR